MIVWLLLACDRPVRPEGLGDLCTLDLGGKDDCPPGLVCTLLGNKYTANCGDRTVSGAYRCALPCDIDQDCPVVDCLPDGTLLHDVSEDDALINSSTCDPVDGTGGGGVGSYCQMGCVEYDTATCPEIPE